MAQPGRIVLVLFYAFSLCSESSSQYVEARSYRLNLTLYIAFPNGSNFTDTYERSVKRSYDVLLTDDHIFTQKLTLTTVKLKLKDVHIKNPTSFCKLLQPQNYNTLAILLYFPESSAKLISDWTSTLYRMATCGVTILSWAPLTTPVKNALAEYGNHSSILHMGASLDDVCSAAVDLLQRLHPVVMLYTSNAHHVAARCHAVIDSDYGWQVRDSIRLDVENRTALKLALSNVQKQQVFLLIASRRSKVDEFRIIFDQAKQLNLLNRNRIWLLLSTDSLSFLPPYDVGATIIGVNQAMDSVSMYNHVKLSTEMVLNALRPILYDRRLTDELGQHGINCDEPSPWKSKYTLPFRKINDASFTFQNVEGKYKSLIFDKHLLKRTRSRPVEYYRSTYTELMYYLVVRKHSKVKGYEMAWTRVGVWDNQLGCTIKFDLFPTLERFLNIHPLTTSSGQRQNTRLYLTVLLLAITQIYF